jgi:hypothetical protein
VPLLDIRQGFLVCALSFVTQVFCTCDLLLCTRLMAQGQPTACACCWCPAVPHTTELETAIAVTINCDSLVCGPLNRELQGRWVVVRLLTPGLTPRTPGTCSGCKVGASEPRGDM